METFTASKHDRHSTDLAMMNGARLVTASETEESRAFAEAKIKQMTGCDPITARFMHKDNFTFRPQFKITIVGNHAPRLANPDDAMRRRFNILGFNIKPDRPDLLLEKKLEAGHGRILGWAIAGCLDWQQNGLVRPALVAEATADYFAGEDLLGQWIADNCTLRPVAFEIPGRLYSDWQKYAEGNGEPPGTAIAFGKKLKKRGIENKSSNGIRAYRGIELRQQPNGGDYGR
jgi:putative DNA primase/helicase